MGPGLERDPFYVCMQEARKAFNEGEVPVGCAVFKEGRLLVSSHNMVQTLKDPLAHAEILAIRQATEILGEKYLYGCEVHVSLEPCLMCTYALVLARVDRIVFYALDHKHGGIMSLYNILDDVRLNHRVRWEYKPREEAQRLLKEFFERLRDDQSRKG
ncbi:nucleoside deaminase [Thermocrinis minervae]|uniref:tRNA(Adenine34) deaminase n=1 Tax=Thermocrinis minervae TaxID=381751 RepID=A0A1M6TCM8_9AQUI|nr:nucleoside deaminase [Thermocrinis minervae]SHK54730.1 tRNA(adenine34) deaminase [Thermocrinis minervae]